MAGTCIHGYQPGTCLICQTLGTQPAAETEPDRASRGTRTADRGRPVDPAATPTRSRALVKPRTGPRVVPKEAPRTGSPASLKLIGLAVAVVAVIVVAWTVLHLVFAVLHILELIGVAAVFGYLGWVVGNYHGRRSARHD